MTSPSSQLRQSSGFLRQLLFTYWLGASLLIAAGLVLNDLLTHQKQIVREADQAVQLVGASLRTSMTAQQRQELLEADGLADRMQGYNRVNLLLVVDQMGRITYASRAAWRLLPITDPLFDHLAVDDPDFMAVSQCFRRRMHDCMQLRSHDWHLHFSGVTVVRPVSMSPRDLGLPRQSYLVLINFDAGMLIGDVLQDVPLLLLFASILAMLLAVILWYSLAARLLPQLVEASQTDSLTQLINRTSFMDTAMELLAEAEERQGDLVFAILDIDHFKRINDTYGHGCGDAALASVGSLLLTVTRPEDLVCRFGGEEFAMLLSARRDAASKALERLRLQLEMNCLTYRGHRIPLTASIGAAATSQCGYNIDFLYNAADKALYVAKHGGRNRLEWNAGEIISRLPISSTRLSR
jgi:diguanylate cyclase (GGDEF)-like protein